MATKYPPNSADVPCPSCRGKGLVIQFLGKKMTVTNKKCLACVKGHVEARRVCAKCHHWIGDCRCRRNYNIQRFPLPESLRQLPQWAPLPKPVSFAEDGEATEAMPPDWSTISKKPAKPKSVSLKPTRGSRNTPIQADAAKMGVPGIYYMERDKAHAVICWNGWRQVFIIQFKQRELAEELVTRATGLPETEYEALRLEFRAKRRNANLREHRARQKAKEG